MWEAHHVTYPTDVEEFLNVSLLYDLFHIHGYTSYAYIIFCLCSQDELSTWNCDIFRLELLTNMQPLKYIGHELFKRYGLSERFKVCFNNYCNIIIIIVN